MRLLGKMELEFFWFSVFFLDGLGMRGLMSTRASFDLHVRLSNEVEE